MEPFPASFTKLIECYFEMWSLFAQMLLIGPAPPHGQARMTMQRDIPRHLQAEYHLLQLPVGVSLTDVHTQYRKLAKHYHPDAGGGHTDFLALQQAHEHVVEYLQTLR